MPHSLQPRPIRNARTPQRSSARRHSLQEFGTVVGTRGQIRATRLEDRLAPKVPFPHRHTFYHWVYISQGKGWHEIDLIRYKVLPGQWFLMKPAQVHLWELSLDAKGVVIEFEGTPLDPSAQTVPDHVDLSASKEVRVRVSALLEMMVRENERNDLQVEDALEHLLSMILIEIDRLALIRSNRPTGHSRAEIDHFLTLVNQYWDEHHAVEFYAQKMKLTAKALTMRVSRGLGKSARAVVQERILLEAKRLLTYSQHSIQVIAERTGFEDANYFTRFFKAHIGTTPSEFRRK